MADDLALGKVDKGKDIAQDSGVRAAAAEEEVEEEEVADRGIAQDRGILAAGEVVEDRVVAQDKEVGSPVEEAAADVLEDKKDTFACYDQGSPFRLVHPPYARGQYIVAHWEQRCSRRSVRVDSKEE